MNPAKGRSVLIVVGISTCAINSLKMAYFDIWPVLWHCLGQESKGVFRLSVLSAWAFRMWRLYQKCCSSLFFRRLDNTTIKPSVPCTTFRKSLLSLNHFECTLPTWSHGTHQETSRSSSSSLLNLTMHRLSKGSLSEILDPSIIVSHHIRTVVTTPEQRKQDDYTRLVTWSMVVQWSAKGSERMGQRWGLSVDRCAYANVPTFGSLGCLVHFRRQPICPFLLSDPSSTILFSTKKPPVEQPLRPK